MSLTTKPTHLALILSDFGREAGIRFTQTLATEERRF